MLQDNQFVVTKIGNATIDLYAMFATLSRSTRSLNLKLPSAEHEANLCNLWCFEAARRITQNLRDATDAQVGEMNKTMAKVARDLIQHGHTVPQHPLGF